jgi:adenylosuccinate lyase
LVEIEYFIALWITLPQLEGVKVYLIVYATFIKNFYWRCPLIKETEKVTNHDVKAVEQFFIKEAFEKIILNTKNSSILVLLLKI